MGKMIEVNNVSMRFRMANDRVSSFKEFAIRKLKGDLKYSEFEALKNVSFLRSLITFQNPSHSSGSQMWLHGM